ncbi:MAG: BolA family protein [Candidatus Binatia bacterium]
MTPVEKIESLLRERLGAVHVEVEDESALHAGHAGAAAGGGHYSCLVVADSFEGQTPLERHRRVYQALGDLMKSEIHALALRTFSPAEWADRGSGPRR